MAESAGFEPVRRGSDHTAAAPRANEPPADVQASRPPRPAGGLRPSQLPLPGETTRRTGSPSPAEGPADQQVQRLRPSGAPAGAARPLARPSTVPARPIPDVLRGSGQPLTAPLKEEMQARLGADLSDVRVHADSAARASAAEVGARAYTSGNHVVVGDEGTDKHTLAHELTHVIQQRQGPVAGTDRGNGFKVSDPFDVYEKAAEANAARVMRAPFPLAAGPGPGDSEVLSLQQAAAPQRTIGNAAVTRMVQRAPAGSEQAESSSSVHEAAASGRQGGAPPAQAAVQVLVPNVLDVLNRFGIPLGELEMRMLDPEGVIIGIVYADPPITALGGMNLAQVYQWLTANFTSACGDTANLLRDITFPESGAERSLHTLTEVVAELRRSGDANIRINSFGHAFFVERRGGNCRILQSYFGRYALAHSAGGAAHAGATTMPAAQLADRLQAIGDHHLANRSAGRSFTTDADEQALFGGPLLNADDISDSVNSRGEVVTNVNLRGEVVTNVRPENEQYSRAQAQLAKFASTWNEISTSALTPAGWLETWFGRAATSGSPSAAPTGSAS